MPVAYEEFVENANQSTTVDGLVDVFLTKVKEHGLDKMIFCLLTDHKQIGLEAGVGHLRNYPDDWMQYYFEKRYDQIDPVISYCYQKLGTFSWEEMQENLSLTKEQSACLNMGIESGLNNGICTPLWGPHRFAGIGLASSEKKDTFDGRYDLITAYCNHFYIAFQRLQEQNDSYKQEVQNIVLTTRQREILLWAYKGKSNNDIGDILNLSTDTIKYHFKSIYQMLGVNHRVPATAKAIALGLIHP